MELVEGADLGSIVERLAASDVSEVGEAQWREAVTTAFEEARRREVSVSDDGAPEAPVAPRPAGEEAAPEGLHPTRHGHIAHAVEILRQVAEATHVLHESGVVHRDIKPSNIMLAADGGHAVLMDLGLAQLVDDAEGRLTRTRQFVGTLRYASPEQVMAVGSIDRRSDVYSLGATLWECLTLRPLFGATDQTPTPELIQRIMTDEPERPRRWNPRVPVDLEAIVLRSLEKKPERRYATARDLAEDLARWKRGDPVSAQPPTLGYFLKKLFRRHKLKIAAAAVALVLLAVWGGRKILRDRALLGHLQRAERLFGEEALEAARGEVEAALALDPASPSARTLAARVGAAAKKRAARATAAAAREEATRLQAASSELRAAIATEEKALMRLLERLVQKNAPMKERAPYNRRAEALARQRAEAERLEAAAEAALERAARTEAPHHGGVAGPETRAALEAFFLAGWKAAMQGGDRRRARRLEERMRAHALAVPDLGVLLVEVEPPGADVCLFRYVSRAAIRGAGTVVDRLVPAPVAVTGAVAALPAGFHPGDLCLVATAVDEGSIAWRAGLRRGDLVIRLNGHPCGDGLFVQRVAPDGPAARAGIQPLDRLETVDADPVEGWFEWRRPAGAPASAAEHTHRLVAGGLTIEARCAAAHEILAPRRETLVLARVFGLLPGAPPELLRGQAPARMDLLALHDGKALRVVVPRGQRSGIGAEPTAYPLILSPASRIAPGEPLELPADSYLLLVRRPGFATQRYPVEVERGARAHVRLTLLEEAAVPPGFVHVPAGPFRYGGDAAQAFRPEPARVVDLRGYFIGRREVTTRQWFAFVNDPETLRHIAAKKAEGRTVCLPRDAAHPEGYATFRDGRYLPAVLLDESPILGISWRDVERYLRWRNRRAARAGEPWRFDLPGQLEWEKAARGVDGRFFPWGNRFHPTLAVGLARKRSPLSRAPGGFEPRDESPFGVQDMAGSRYEWTRDRLAPGSTSFLLRGGFWGARAAIYFRAASRLQSLADQTDANRGFRLAAHPRR